MEELVAELSLWVVLGEESFVVGHLGVKTLEACGGDGVDLCPVGAGVERRKFLFDEGEEGLDGVVLGLPCEVDGEGGSLVGHAEPEVVGGYGAELGDVEVGRDAIAELLDG